MKSRLLLCVPFVFAACQSSAPAPQAANKPAVQGGMTVDEYTQKNFPHNSGRNEVHAAVMDVIPGENGEPDRIVGTPKKLY